MSDEDRQKQEPEAEEPTGGGAGGPGREAEEPAGGDPAAEVEGDLDQLVADLRRERDEYLDLAQRARADFENFKRRAARDGQSALARGKAEVGRAVLPALDSLERALGSEGGDALAEGVALVHRELVDALASAGVQTIDPTGEHFDPNLHEALSSRPAADGEASGIVAETVQRGYRLDETLLRPARVVVTA